jgi:hypothetical protein
MNPDTELQNEVGALIESKYKALPDILKEQFLEGKLFFYPPTSLNNFLRTNHKPRSARRQHPESSFVRRLRPVDVGTNGKRSIN